jgi:putative NADH-flavin reductase
MIIAVFGASGRLGHRFIDAATAAGHTLRLHYRAKPSELVPEHSTVIVGSLADPTAVREVLRGADAAVVLLGHKADARVPYIAAATKLIVNAMKALGMSRLVVVTGATVGEASGNLGLAMKITGAFARRSAHDGMMEDRDEQERLVKSSRLEGWTVVKPSKLTDGPPSDSARMAPTLPVGMSSKVARASLARVLVQELETPQCIHQSVFVDER